MKPKVCVLRTDGTNCDRELRYSFQLAGADAEIVPFNAFISGYNPETRRHVSLEDYTGLGLAGGFSHGDYIRAGRIQAMMMLKHLGEGLEKFIEEGKPVVGICNGFQVLVQTGFVPSIDRKVEQQASLAYNDVGHFRCRWVYLETNPNNNCIWTNGIKGLWIPIAHGEGKFTTTLENLDRLESDNLVAVRYARPPGMPENAEFVVNPNGSMNDIAGISNPNGNVFGLMPHPERYWTAENHPHWTLQKILTMPYIDPCHPVVQQRIESYGPLPREGQGLQIFRNAVKYMQEKFG